MVSQNNNETQRRSEERQTITSALLTFLGSRESDHLAFEYLLVDTSLHGAKIAIPRWVVSRDHLRIDEVINLHVPFRQAAEIYDQGRVTRAEWSEEYEAQLCGIRLIEKPPMHTPVYLRLENGKVQLDLKNTPEAHKLVIKVLKDMVLLKKGILIYLDHMIPFFSRISHVTEQNYTLLRDFLFEEARSQLVYNHRSLEEIYERLAGELTSDRDIGAALVLEEIRPFMESELYADLFKIALESPAIDPYLHAIKQLEKKLYAGYNTLAMIYLGTLDE